MQRNVSVTNELKIIFGAFIILLIGAIFIGVLADNIYDLTNTYEVYNENFTVTNAQVASGIYVNLTYDDWARVINVSNATNQLLTEGTDYSVALATGGVNISTNNTDGRTYYYASYEYRPDDYVSDSTSRTLMPLITIFFAIFLVGAAMMAINWEWAKDWMKGGRRGGGRI